MLQELEGALSDVDLTSRFYNRFRRDGVIHDTVDIMREAVADGVQVFVLVQSYAEELPAISDFIRSSNLQALYFGVETKIASGCIVAQTRSTQVIRPQPTSWQMAARRFCLRRPYTASGSRRGLKVSDSQLVNGVSRPTP